MNFMLPIDVDFRLFFDPALFLSPFLRIQRIYLSFVSAGDIVIFPLLRFRIFTTFFSARRL